MNCPYFDERYIGICGASASGYVPSIEKMETYCFKQTYRLCAILSEYLSENKIAMSKCASKKELAHI